MEGYVSDFAMESEFMEVEFEMHPSAVERVTAITNELVGCIRRVDLAPRPKQFVGDRPKHTITKEQMTEEPIFGVTDKSHEFVARFFSSSGKIYGILHDEYVGVKKAVDHLMKIKWVSSYLGPKFIEEQLFRWCMARFQGKYKEFFHEWLISVAKSEINENEIIVPCAFFELERSMRLGIAELIPISEDIFDVMEANCLDKAGERRNDVISLFSKMKSEFQGLAGVKMTLVAQRQWANERALVIAEQVIAMLRLYSDAAVNHRVFCPVAIKGAEYAPQTKVISTRGSSGFSYTETAAKGGNYWRLSNAEALKIESNGWPNLGKLIFAPNLNEFQKKLRTCLLAYSRGLTLPDIGDRLVYILSSLEGMLLKDSSEPIQQNLGDRLAFLLSKNPAERRLITERVRSVYRIRSEYIHHRIATFEENEDVGNFFCHACDFMFFCIREIDSYQSQKDLIEAIEQVKFGGSFRLQNGLSS